MKTSNFTEKERIDIGKRFYSLREGANPDKDKSPTQKQLIKDISKKLNMPLNDSGGIEGLSQKDVSNIEKGDKEPTLKQLFIYHKYFNVSFEYLLCEVELKETISKDENVNQFVKDIGLTEKSIEKLKEYTTIKNKNSNRNYYSLDIEKIDILNDLFSNNSLDKILNCIIQYTESKALFQKVINKTSRLFHDINLTNEMEESFIKQGILELIKFELDNYSTEIYKKRKKIEKNMLSRNKLMEKNNGNKK